jgi:uncharacterized protein YkwD
MNRAVALIASTLSILVTALPQTAFAHARSAHHRHAHASHACKKSSRHHMRRSHCRASTSKKRRAHASTHVLAFQGDSVNGTAASTPALATAVTVPQGPCQNTTLTPSATNQQLIDEAILCLVNKERTSKGESPLALNPALTRAALAHSEDMVANNYFSHAAPNGQQPPERVIAAGYLPSSADGYRIGENIAWGTLEYSTPQSIFEAWLASPEHLANILESHYTETGIGIDPQAPSSLSEGNAGATYTQDFGVIE